MPIHSESPSESEGTEKSKQRGKKPYMSPVLTTYGNVRALTTGGSGVKMEGKTMTNMMRFP